MIGKVFLNCEYWTVTVRHSQSSGQAIPHRRSGNSCCLYLYIDNYIFSLPDSAFSAFWGDLARYK